MKKKFLVAGGDMRQLYLAEALAETYDVYITGFDRSVIQPQKSVWIEGLSAMPERVDCVVLPIPASQDEVFVTTPFYRQSIPLDNIPSVMKNNGFVLGGRLSENFKALFDGFGIASADYLSREELSVLNAVPTAEGALQIAMEELPTTIFGSRVLILGMGRISKSLIRILSGFSAEITVAARKCSDIAWAEIFGCKGVNIGSIESILPNTDILFNTVPASVLDGERLSLLNKECLVIDLASKPGGVDFDTASGMGIKAVWALSLPGRVAPVSAGRIIASTIENIVAERGTAHE